MKITIDSRVCKKKGLSFEEVLSALAVKYNNGYNNITMANLTDKEVLGFDEESNEHYITPHWSDVMDEIICDSSSSTDNEEKLMILAKKMREIFPAGKQQRPGSPYYYRCNNKEVVLKLKKFFSLYGNYSDDEILSATKKYVDAFHGDYRSMRLIKYFILKDDVKPCEDENGNIVNKVVQVSDLATFLENEDSEVATTSDDWLMSARN